jgi:hypothetical protein
MKKSLQTLTFLFLAFNLSGQTITDYYTIPTSPTSEDFISLVVAINTSSAGCWLASSDVIIDTSNNAIAINGCYFMGITDTVCPSIDTFQIGQLQNGSYQILLSLQASQSVSPNGDCEGITF